MTASGRTITRHSPTHQQSHSTSTRTAKEARDWAIGGRHGEIRAGMCGLPHLPHVAQIPDQRFTLS